MSNLIVWTPSSSENDYSYGHSGINYLKDGLIIISASLVGLLYGAAACAMIMTSLILQSVIMSASLACVAAYEAGSSLMKGAPITALGVVVVSPVIGVGLLAVTSVALAFTAFLSPFLIVKGAITSAAHAKNNPDDSFLRRIFGGFTKLQENVAMVNNLNKGKLSGWGNSIRIVD